MNETQIKANLDNILTQVLSLLEPEDYEKAKGKVYIAGGAIVSLTLGETPVDYDLWCEDEATAGIFKSCIGTSIPLTTGADLLANTENGLTWKLRTGEVVQVVTRFVGPPSRVFESFDYTHCKSFYSPRTGELSYDREMILDKKLHYDGLKDQFALNTLKRFGKFISRGWTPDNETVMNLYRAIQKSPPIDDPVEHQKQTVGFYGSSHK